MTKTYTSIHGPVADVMGSSLVADTAVEDSGGPDVTSTEPFRAESDEPQ